MKSAYLLLLSILALSSCSVALSEERKSWPRTCDAAVEQILAELPEGEQRKLAEFNEDDLIQLHLSFGMGIRNQFGLWAGNWQLTKDCSGSTSTHPDEVSSIVTEKTWKRVREKFGVQ
ncbi:hypothetical protein MWU53_04705 [Aliiroseovarius sp. S1123]|uniref:DUF6794 domain-containing protein n=1 Tax=unclassified Aliiroseovarius TaxID=2623558 RepID=UPI001FF1F6DE|nr:DUF6794 domain-containing protein [Aliiroseovarius sp. S1123]MCK0170353.1 hypothetical protein [Aliiroseovarius sp. S1123]